MQKLDLNLLRTLCALVESGSVSYTSQYLNTSTSSVSYALNKLRDHFLDPLMVRVRNGMQPTLLALDIYNKIKPTLMLLDKQLQGCHDGVSTGKNLYKINSRSMFDSWLTNVLLRDNKLIDVNLVFCNTYVDNVDRLEALRRRQIDIDIGPHLPVDNAVKQYMFTLTGFDVVCQSEHPRLRDSASWGELKKERVIGYSFEDIEKTNVSNLVRMNHNENIKMNSFDNVMAVVSCSEYFTLTPKGLTHYFCKLYNLRQVKTDAFDKVKVNFYFNILKSTANDPFVKSLIDYFKAMTAHVL